MNNLRRVWEFLFATLVIGASPVLVFILLSILMGPINPDPTRDAWSQKILFALCAAVSLVLPLATLFFVCRWRKKHRKLPDSLFGVEVACGILSGAIYFLLFIFMWGMALIE